MAASGRRVNNRTANRVNSRTTHIVYDGNAVRKLQTAPEEQVEIVELPGRKAEERAKTRTRVREQAFHMSPAYIAFLSIVCAAVMGLCVNYIRVQTSIQERIENISTLKSQVELMEEQNSATAARIAMASDINQIYKVATEELGMVKPDSNQVIYYDQTEREYVQQYESIPTEP